MTKKPSFLEIFEHLGLDVPKFLPDVAIMSLVVIIFLTITSYLATKNLKKIPSGFQALLEIIVKGFENFLVSIMGKLGRDFLPFLATLFLYILFMNLSGHVPLMHAPTANLNTTLALALVVFFATHYYGFKANKLGYLKHLAGEPLWLAPFMLPVHLIGELVRPVSLSLRLFGNIMGENTVIAILIGLSPFILGIIPIPVQVPMMALGLLFCIVQALIFMVLSSIYIAGAIGHHTEISADKK